LHESHQVPQKNRTTGLPLYEERVTEPPSSARNVKGGASFFEGNLCTPNDSQSCETEEAGGAAARTGETGGMKNAAVQKTVSKKLNAFLMTLPRRLSDILLPV